MPLFDLFWAMLWLFLWVAWFWTVIGVVGDIFRSEDMNGGAKAFWVLFVILIPWLGVLMYLLTRGDGMARRSQAAAVEQEEMARDYIRDAAGTSTADELQKLGALKASGVLNDAEYEAQKAKLLA
jgi:hypothetical protein